MAPTVNGITDATGLPTGSKPPGSNWVTSSTSGTLLFRRTRPEPLTKVAVYRLGTAWEQGNADDRRESGFAVATEAVPADRLKALGPLTGLLSRARKRIAALRAVDTGDPATVRPAPGADEQVTGAGAD